MGRLSKKLKFTVKLTEEDFQRMVNGEKLIVYAYPCWDRREYIYFLSIEKAGG